MKVVVTGATSMIGHALIKSLIDHKVEKIYAVIRPGSKNMYRIVHDNRIEYITCLCQNYEELPELITDDCNLFYHLAWIPSTIKGRIRYFDVETAYKNIGQSLKALDAAAKLGCKNYVGVGSQSEYGYISKPAQSPEDPTDPVTAYAMAKDCCRRMCMLKGKALGINVQWVRVFSVYGPNDRNNTLISSILPKILNNEDIFLTECNQLWDYIYEDDAGEGLYYAGLSKGSNIYCLGGGEAKPLRWYIEKILLCANSKSNLHFGALQNEEEYVMDFHANILKLVENTEWPGPKVSFEDGINNIIQRYDSK